MVRPVLASLASLLACTPAAALKAMAKDADAAQKERPIMKVVRLLQDMQQELTASLEDDKAVHEKLDCWCTAGKREKTAAIEANEQKEEQLEASLAEALAKMQELKSKRDSALDEVNRDVEALQQASTLRMKENKEFHADEVNLIEAVQACDQAITVLKEYNPKPGFVQEAARKLAAAGVVELSRARFGARAVAYGAVLRNFLAQAKGPGGAFLAVPGMQSYAPQSGQVFGVLEQMKEDFEKDLAESQEREKRAAEDYEALKAAKKEEISTGRKLVADLDQEIATLKEKHAEAFKELEDTKAQLKIDRTFLATLEKKCAVTDDEFAKRVKDRTAEIAAVEDTIAILNDDTAFDTFDKTVNGDADFLQLAAVESAALRARLGRAADALDRGAFVAGAPALALLAARARLDAFTKVKEEIDKMVAELAKQQKDESKHRDFCVDELNKNNRTTEAAYDEQNNLQAKMADLEKDMEYLSGEINATTTEIAEMQDMMKIASENREAENADYQQTVQDHRLTQIILRKALDRMSKVYAFLAMKEQPGAAHTALSGTDVDPGNGPARFTKYEEHAGGSKVLRMLEEVITDSKKTEADAIAAEQDAQAAYENIMKESNSAIATYTKKVANMQADLSKDEEDHVATKADLMANLKEIEELHEALGDLKRSCDYVMKNFDARQAARAAEMDALREAMSILSGAK